MSESYGIAGVSIDNIEQVFNPYVSGVAQLAEQRQRLVSAGMSVELADSLLKQYLNKVTREGNVFSLIDFFVNREAKEALHSPHLAMKDVCLNFATSRPQYATVRQAVSAATVSSATRMRPVTPGQGLLGGIQARLFSTSTKSSSSSESSSDSSSDSEQEEKSPQKGRFFKFLETAETLDKQIEREPERAKKVGPSESVFSFDADDLDLQVGG